MRASSTAPLRGFSRTPLAESRPATAAEVVERLKQALPVMVARSHLKRYGWPFSAGYMANIDADKQKASPAHIRVGSRVVYLRDGDEGLIAWLLAQAK